MQRIATYLRRGGSAIKRYWQSSGWHKFWIALAVVLAIVVGGMYGIAQWYRISERDKPLVLGTSFIPAYAESLGLDAKETMDALIDELGIRHFRLTSYWSQLEPADGRYDFSLLDWQFEKAEQANATVTLSLGLRQPRWPECHMPDWARELPDGEWQQRLNDFIAATVERYKDSPALRSYQLENEFFLEAFGICHDFDRERLISEYQLVKSLDPETPVIISRSNNALGIPLGEPKPDEYAISIYKRVWDGKTGRYLEYPFPPWYYGFLAGLQKIVQGRDMIIHELQAEAWPPHGRPIAETTLEEQNKSINAERLRDRFQYGIDTGMREIYLWGAEYWLYRKQILNDPSLWDVAKTQFHRHADQ
jgi:hypothetical protein